MDAIAKFEKTVLPSFLENNSHQVGQVNVLSKLPMRIGRVVDIHGPESEKNYSKRFIEYDVWVETGNGGIGPATGYVLPHCLIISQYGGVADYTRWTPRPNTGDRIEPDFGASSVVCVMLINGSSFGGLIVGGPQVLGGQNSSIGEVDVEEDGHNRIDVFNGLKETVDKDGQWTVFRKGATDAFGSKLDPSDPEGTKLQFLKGGDVALDSRHDVRVTSDNASLFQSQQASTFQSVLADVQIKAATTVQTTSAFVKLGAATDAMVLGTRYRAAETAMLSTVMAAFTQISALLTGLMAATPPIMIPGPSGTVPVAPLLAATAALTTAASAAIGAFNAAAPSHLSLKNSLD